MIWEDFEHRETYRNFAEERAVFPCSVPSFSFSLSLSSLFYTVSSRPSTTGPSSRSDPSLLLLFPFSPFLFSSSRAAPTMAEPGRALGCRWWIVVYAEIGKSHTPSYRSRCRVLARPRNSRFAVQRCCLSSFSSSTTSRDRRFFVLVSDEVVRSSRPMSFPRVRRWVFWRTPREGASSARLRS